MNTKANESASAIAVLWIDGQTEDGTGSVPARLELRRDGERYRWLTQAYDANGRPAGDCTEDTEVSGDSIGAAMLAASGAWSGPTWNLRTTEAPDPDPEELVCCDCADNGRVADASRYCSRCGRGLCERCAGRDAVGAAMHAGRGWPVGVCSRCTK